MKLVYKRHNKMSRRKVILPLFLFNILCVSYTDCARILGVYPTPSISHQVVYRTLTLELVKRGHEVVVITPDPAYRNEITPENLTEIDTGKSYKLIEELLFVGEVASTIKRGVILDFIANSKIKSLPYVKLGLDIFTHHKVKDLIADRNQTFDLVILEGQLYSPLIFSKIFNAPAVLFSSFYGSPDNLLSVGAVSRHPVFYPHYFRYKFRHLSFFEEIQEYISEWYLYKYDAAVEEYENNFLKAEFGVDAPTIKELKKNYVELLFVNSHPIFDGNRPVPPGVVYLGALHLKPTKPLPEDLKSYLDNSTCGVIYVSLGTNVRPSMMDQELLDTFLGAFEALPYNILWKFDGDDLERIPENVRIRKWFPQRDLLGHPKIKLFITQGGLQSTDEAIDAEVPMVGIPFLADQWYNVNKYVELGIGVHVDAMTLTADKLVKAAKQVIGDDSFRKNIANLRAVLRDQPQKPLDRAVWWTEYVLRHGLSKRLLSPTALVSWSEYLMMNFFKNLAIGTVFVAVFLVVVYYSVWLVFIVNTKFKVKQS